MNRTLRAAVLITATTITTGTLTGCTRYTIAPGSVLTIEHWDGCKTTITAPPALPAPDHSAAGVIHTAVTG